MCVHGSGYTLFKNFLNNIVNPEQTTLVKKNNNNKIKHKLVKSGSEVERVQKYSTQVKVPLHYWNFT